MLLKAKHTVDGAFDKLKSGLVAGGHLQDRDICSTTVSVFIVAALAAGEHRALAAIDFPGAFVNSYMPLEGDTVALIRLNKILTNVLISIDPTCNPFFNSNGTCVVKLKEALYVSVESAKLWYDKILNDLIKLKIHN
jgi:hypothetical protein